MPRFHWISGKAEKTSNHVNRLQSYWRPSLNAYVLLSDGHIFERILLPF
jgi:hypothetical protein